MTPNMTPLYGNMIMTCLVTLFDKRWKQWALPARIANVGAQLRSVSKDIKSMVEYKQSLIYSHIHTLQNIDFTYLTVGGEYLRKVFYFLLTKTLERFSISCKEMKILPHTGHQPSSHWIPRCHCLSL